MKRMLAVRRWWIVGLILALVVVRVVAAAALNLLGSAAADVGQAALIAVDVTCLILAVVAVVAFVQYGRLFNARIPTE